MRFVRRSQELIPICPLVPNPNLDRSEVQVAASPDFLWESVALANFVRLSLLKGVHAASSSVAWQEVRVRGWIGKVCFCILLSQKRLMASEKAYLRA